MSCSSRIQQFPRNFLCWQAPGCIKIYSFKSMAGTYLLLPSEKHTIYSDHRQVADSPHPPPSRQGSQLMFVQKLSTKSSIYGGIEERGLNEIKKSFFNVYFNLMAVIGLPLDRMSVCSLVNR